MRPVTSLFLRTLRQSHVVVTSCDVYFPGSSTPVVLPVSGGSLTLDRNAMIRRTGSVQVPWSLREGATLGLDLRALAFGGYAIPKRGVRYSDGTVELVELGRLRVDQVAWGASAETATLTLVDRMAQVRDEQFLTPYAAAGKRPAQAAVEIVTDVFGTAIGYHALVDPAMTLLDAFYTGSRGDAVTRLAASFAGAAYFDADGDFVFDGAPGAVYLPMTGNLTNGSPVVTGIASTAQLVVGMSAAGPGIPPGRKIKSVDSATQVTLDGPATLSVTKSCDGRTGQKQLTGLDDTSVLTVGMAVDGTDAHRADPFSAGTQVASIDSPTQVTLNKPLGTWIVDLNLPLSVSFTASGGGQLLTFSGAVSTVDSAPVWSVDAGDTGVLVDAAETLERAGVVNGVLVRGQASADTPPFSALVIVTDVLSPLLWGGPFGKVVRIEESSVVQTVDQAQTMAAALLASALGLTRSLTLTASPNPALEPADVLSVTFDDGRVERHVIDSIQLDLGPAGAQALATRSVYSGDPLATTPATLTGAFTGARELRRELAGARVAEAVA